MDCRDGNSMKRLKQYFVYCEVAEGGVPAVQGMARTHEGVFESSSSALKYENSFKTATLTAHPLLRYITNDAKAYRPRTEEEGNTLCSA